MAICIFKKHSFPPVTPDSRLESWKSCFSSVRKWYRSHGITGRCTWCISETSQNVKHCIGCFVKVYITLQWSHLTGYIFVLIYVWIQRLKTHHYWILRIIFKKKQKYSILKWQCWQCSYCIRITVPKLFQLQFILGKQVFSITECLKKDPV